MKKRRHFDETDNPNRVNRGGRGHAVVTQKPRAIGPLASAAMDSDLAPHPPGVVPGGVGGVPHREAEREPRRSPPPPGGRPEGSRSVLPLGAVALIRELRKRDPADPEAHGVTAALVQVMAVNRRVGGSNPVWGARPRGVGNGRAG